MNQNQVQSIQGQTHVCKVRYSPRVVGKPLPGEVVCNGDVAYFEFGSGRDVTINGNEVCWGPGKPSFLQVGDEIVAQVEERGRRGHFVVTAWTHIKDWESVLKELERSRAPKTAPAIPPVQKPVKLEPTVQVAAERRNQTGRDRRPIFHPKAPLAETTVECSTAPAPETDLMSQLGAAIEEDRGMHQVSEQK